MGPAAPSERPGMLHRQLGGKNMKISWGIGRAVGAEGSKSDRVQGSQEGSDGWRWTEIGMYLLPFNGKKI